jgi:hypothetical protein
VGDRRKGSPCGKKLEIDFRRKTQIGKNLPLRSEMTSGVSESNVVKEKRDRPERLALSQQSIAASVV